MLEVGCLVSDFFQLILGVPLKLTPDAVNKDLRAFDVLLEEGLELWPSNRSGVLMTALVLIPSEADRATEK